ncbi:MAG: 50S ribosomal protein L6 [Candidatus Levybacteria bacterium]|nr:50S ribosomal protein L6 [Candidatus Levybacteria bacterium]
MSKLAKKPVIIKEGVNVTIENGTLKVSGPKGVLAFKIPEGVVVKVTNGQGIVTILEKNTEDLKPVLGLTRAMLANMVTGVYSGFEKKLELSGVGYRAQVSGNDLSLSVGFSHPVKIAKAPGINFEVADNIITVSGIDKDSVGSMAAEIRAIQPREPYKGKGIGYVGERIRRKAGKAAKTLGATK